MTGERPAPVTHPEIARLRRRVGVSITLRRALVCAVLATLFVALAQGRMPLWAVITIVVLAVLIAFVSARGSVLSEWIGARYRYLRRRRRPGGPIPGRVIDVDGCGVRQGDGFELVSAIELTADPSETRLRDGRAHAADTVPLDLLASMMTQYGLDVDIDVVSSGRRVPPGPAYRASYAQGVRFYSAMAQRSTWLILRVDTRRNLDGIVRRGPSRTAGPKALMAATRRLEQRLQERMIRARALPATELGTLVPLMTYGVDPLAGTERWRFLEHESGVSTTYLIDPDRTSTERLDRWWGLDSETTAVVLRLRKASAQAPVRISGVVRYDTTVPIIDDLDDALLLVPGRQAELARATLPGGGSSVTDLPEASLTDVADVQIPVGPAGPVWGISGSDAVALPLFDGSPVPDTLRIEFATELIPLQLVLLRSVGAGASVLVHTDRPQQWATLVATLADPSRFRIADGAPGRSADITVFDGVRAESVPERTLLTLHPPGAVAGFNADVLVSQIGASKVLIRIGERPPFEVVLNPTDEELRYCDLATGPAPAAVRTMQVPRIPRQVPPAEPARPVRAAAAAPPISPVQQIHPVQPTRPVPPPSDPGAPRAPRPARPLPPSPYERGSGVPRKLGGDRWVRPAPDRDADGRQRRPMRPASAPRWGRSGEHPQPDEPPTGSH
ncbi:hypothetical protein GCM10027289_25910 [Tsukamurella serpentis]